MKSFEKNFTIFQKKPIIPVLWQRWSQASGVSGISTELGDPDNGVATGIAWEDVPKD